MSPKNDVMTPAAELPAELCEAVPGDALHALVFADDLRAALAKANRVARLRAWALSTRGDR